MRLAEVPAVSAMFHLSAEKFLDSVGYQHFAEPMAKAEIQPEIVGESRPDGSYILSKAATPLMQRQAAGIEMPAFPPTRAFVESPQDAWSTTGVKETRYFVNYATLREIERKNPVVSTIVNTRCRQLREFGLPSSDPNFPGFKVFIKDKERIPSKEELAKIDQLTDWVYNTGRVDFKDADWRDDLFPDVLTKLGREALTIDQCAIEIRRDRLGKPVDFWVLDGATIKRVIQGGFVGARDQIDPRMFVMANDEFFQKLTAEKTQLIPEDLTTVAYVQEIDGRYCAAFTRQDLIFTALQKRADVRYHGYGYSPLEQAMSTVTAFLNGLSYNAEAFNSGTIPKVGISLKDGNLGPEQMAAIQDEWIANHRGPRGRWRIPIFNREVQVLDFLRNSSDMEYMKYMEFTGSLIASIMGFDLMEAGLRFGQAQSVMNENQDARMKFSKDRGLRDLMSFIETMMNKVFRLNGWGDRFVFKFTGLSPDDKETTSRLMDARVKRDTTVNELRAELDKEPIPGGDIILDPTYLQNLQAQQQGGGGGEEGMPDFGGGDEEGAAPAEGGEEGGAPPAEADQAMPTGEDIDNAVESAFKAVSPERLRRARTTLLK